MKALKHAALATALLAAVGVTAAQAAGPNGVSDQRDVYTDGANATGARDPYTDGGKATRDIYTDGARTMGVTARYTDGSKL